MSLTNPNKVVTEERLSEFYGEILPYLGGMPELLGNKISRGDLYSTTEKMIGQWVDGKPLYQKTINFGYLPNNTSKTVAHNVSNMQTMVSMFGIAIKGDSAGNILPLPYAANDTNTIICLYGNNATVGVSTNTDRSVFTAYITIQYTKTTDSAQAVGVDTDYSTTEKIVGTWIDGKPVYQKTFSLSSAITIGTNWTSINEAVISNCKYLINGIFLGADGQIRGGISAVCESGNAYKIEALAAINQSVKFITVQYIKN